MDVKATLVEKTSKSGNKYQVVILKLTETYEKMVFLDKAELELLNAKNSNSDAFYID